MPVFALRRQVGPLQVDPNVLRPAPTLPPAASPWVSGANPLAALLAAQWILVRRLRFLAGGYEN